MLTKNKACLPSAVRLLAARDYSEAELRDKLVRQGHQDDEIDAAIGELRRRGYLNDERFGHHLRDRYLAGGQYGRLGIGQRLEKKGLAPALVTTLLSGENEDCEYERAAALAAARFPIGMVADFAKVGRFLATRGFAEEVILRVLSRRYGYDDNG